MAASKIDTWLKAGYKLLGTEGIEGIKIERLAKILDLNKSGFYHYFGTMEGFIKSLVQHHIQKAKVIAEEIASCQTIDPDLLLLIVKHKGFFLVESQLLVKSRPPHADEEVDEAGKILNEELLQLWRKASTLPQDDSVALAYLNIIRHFFYARVDAEHINYEFLHRLTVETKGVMDKVITEQHLSSHGLEGLGPTD